MSFRKKLPEIAVLGFLLPNLLGFAIFTLFPVCLAFAMAFTNWSLKPGQATSFLGLQNFTDLLGVRALGESSTGLAAAYFIAAATAVAGLIGLMWGNLAGWRGVKWSGACLGLLGACAFTLGLRAGGEQGILVFGGVALVIGLTVILRDTERGWSMGPGLLPGLALVAALGALTGLNADMWAAYEPNDVRFWKYLYNTLFMMIGIPFTMAGSLGLALLVSKEFPALTLDRRVALSLACFGAGLACLLALWLAGMKNAAVLAMFFWSIASLGLAFNVVSFRTIFYLPTFTSGVAMMVLWKALYNPTSGPVNELLHLVSGVPLEDLPRWLVHNSWAKPALLVMGVWTGIGGTGMLLYLSALSGVPRELHEAAEVDGAGRLASFRHVTWPSVAPTTFFITVMAIIGGLQGGFEQARVMTQGKYETTTLSYYIFNKAFQELDLGYGAAMSWVVFAMIFVATLVNWRFGKEIEE